MNDINIKEYYYQIWKRRQMVGVFLATVILLTAVFTWRQPRIYRAVAIIEIGAETPDVMYQDVLNVSPYGWWSALKYYETQYQILKSRSLLHKVAERAIDQQVVKGMSVDQLTGHLQGGLSIGTDDKSRLAQIYFDDSDPKRATDLANLISEVYVDENLAQKLQGITQAVQWLTDRLDEIRKEKREQEDELQKVKEEYKVVSVGDRESIAKANLLALTESLNRLKNERIELEAQYEKLQDLVKKSDRVEDLTGVISNDLLTKFKHQLAELQTERGRLKDRYGEKHPTMVRINAEMAEVEKQIRQEVANEVGRVKTRYLLAQAQEKEVAKALEKQKMDALHIEGVNRQVADIQAVTNMNQQLFEALQKKLKEVDLSGLMRSNNIRIVDRALDPGSPIRPRVTLNLLMAIVVGLLGGIALALLLEYLDDTLKNQEDIDRYLKLPVLGVIPHYAPPGGVNGSDSAVDYIPMEDSTSAAAEFFRTLRTNVLFLSATQGKKRIMFVSTGPGEGKTSVVINLGITMAQMGQRTVLVELDLRRPRIHTKLRADTRIGVTNVLAGEVNLDEVIRKSEIPNLDYVLAGLIPPNPAELLASGELKALLEQLSSRYDRVIVDSSPIAPVTDAVIISQAVDSVALVVRAGKTHRKAVKLAIEQLRAVKANLMGVVLNDVDIQKSTYGNYQYYKYGYNAYTDREKAEPQIPSATA